MRCHYCSADPDDEALTSVGFIEGGAGVGYTFHACSECLAARRLIPLAEHPEHSDGMPRSYTTEHSDVKGGE